MRKEKYISERTKSSGSYFEICVRLTVNGVQKRATKSINISEYPSKASALKQAIIERDKMINDLNARKYVSTSSLRFCDVYDEMKVLFPKRLTTFRQYDILSHKYLTNIWLMKIQDIEAEHLMLAMNNMVATCSDKTICTAFAICKFVFKTARIKRYVAIDPTEEVILPKSIYKVKSLKKTTDLSTVNAVIEELEKGNGKNERMRLKHHMIAGAIWVMYYCGLRPAEAFALHKDDVDLENKTISVSRQIGSSLTENNVIRPTKTALSTRTVPIPDVLADILQDYMKDECPLLFHDVSGKLLKLAFVQNSIYHLSHRLGIRFNLYQLRHQFSTDLITDNADVRTVMELMGHSSPSMTISYARSNAGKKKEAILQRASANLPEKLPENNSKTA